MKVAILGMLLGAGGFILIGLNGSWLVAIGVYLMVWGNNVNIPSMIRVNEKIEAAQDDMNK